MEDFLFLKKSKPLKGYLLYFDRYYLKGYFEENPENDLSILWNQKKFFIHYKVLISYQKDSSYYLEATYSCSLPLYKIYLESLSYKNLIQKNYQRNFMDEIQKIHFLDQEKVKKKIFKEFSLSFFTFSKEKLPLEFYTSNHLFKKNSRFFYCIKKDGIPYLGISSKNDFQEAIPFLNIIFFLEKRSFPKKISGSKEEVSLSFQRFFYQEKHSIEKKFNTKMDHPTLLLDVSLDYSPEENIYLHSNKLNFPSLSSLEKRPLDLAFILKTSPFDLESFIFFLHQENLALKDLHDKNLSLMIDKAS